MLPHLVHWSVEKLKTVYGGLEHFAAIDDHIVQIGVPVEECKEFDIGGGVRMNFETCDLLTGHE